MTLPDWILEIEKDAKMYGHETPPREDISRLIDSLKVALVALKCADAAMTYAFEDHSDQYYLNVQNNIRETLAKIRGEK